LNILRRRLIGARIRSLVTLGRRLIRARLRLLSGEPHTRSILDYLRRWLDGDPLHLGHHALFDVVDEYGRVALLKKDLAFRQSYRLDVGQQRLDLFVGQPRG
jgi:hypothetical protein